MAASFVGGPTPHTLQFFEQRSANDPVRDLSLTYVRQEMLNRLAVVTSAAVESVPDGQTTARRDCRTVLHYVDPEKASKEWCADPDANQSGPSLHPVWGSVDKAVPAVVEDVRGREEEFSLERNGQVWVNHKSSMTPVDFLDNDKVKTLYYQECVDLLRQVCPAAQSIYLSNNLVRSTDRGPAGRPPGYKMHVDQDPASRMKVLYKVVPRALADEIVEKGKRFQIMNIWRPLATVYKDPFAVCDLQTVSAADLRTMRFRLPNGTPLSNTAVLPSPRHQLYYKHRQRPDEPVVFLQFDSGHRAAPAPGEPPVLGQAPHTAIIDDEVEERERRRAAGDADADAWCPPDRWSIEIRALIVYDEEGCRLPPDHLALAAVESEKKKKAEQEATGGEEAISCPYTAFIRAGRS